jgi:hypothetical protein
VTTLSAAALLQDRGVSGKNQVGGSISQLWTSVDKIVEDSLLGQSLPATTAAYLISLGPHGIVWSE